VDEARGLILNGLDYFGMAMTGVGDADAACEVQLTGALIIPYVGTFTSFHNQIRDVKPNGGQV
jgi:hypothetical protein